MDWPAEIVEDIVSRLSMKHVCRCKCVCPRWNQLISTDRFKRLHRERTKVFSRMGYILEIGRVFSPNTYRCLTEANPPYIHRVLYSYVPMNEVVTSGFGLVYISNREDEYILWNPMTKESKTLPPCPLVTPLEEGYAQAVFGLGHKQSSDDFILFCIFVNIPTNLCTRVMFYSRNQRKWQQAPDFPHRLHKYRPGVFVYGKLHWLVDWSGVKPSIGSLSIEDMGYSTVELCGINYDPARTYDIDRLDEETLVFYTSLCHPMETYRIWILRDYRINPRWVGINFLVRGSLTLQNHLITIQPMAFLTPSRDSFSFRVDPSGLYGVYFITRRMYRLVDSKKFRQGGTCWLTKFVETFEHPCRPFELLQ